MLLIDAIYINNGGGKRLLDLLIQTVIKEKVEIIFLLDNRISDEYKNLSNATFISASLFKRHIFYLKNKKKITSVLTFANIPPTVKLNCRVYTYFHNVLLLSNKSFNINSLNLFLKSRLILLFKNNTMTWLVQSAFVKKEINKYWNINLNKIQILPIFDVNFRKKNVNKIIFNQNEIKFIYVSDGHFYKNHINLIQAFSKYSKLFPNSSLTLTIGDKYKKIKKLISEKKANGINIIDKGIITKDQLSIEYEKADICVFPSLFESFGLGLIEASLHDLPICASDLAYVYEVVKPTYVFDPNSEQSILNCLLSVNINSNLKSKLVCENNLTNLISLLI